MIKELSWQEYNTLLANEDYPIISFMGGLAGRNDSHSIYIVGDKAILVSMDETEKLEEIKNLQIIDANDYVNSFQKDLQQ